MNARTRITDTPDSRRIEVSRELPVSAGRAWSLPTNTRRWPDRGPSVRGVDCTDREIRAGATGTVETGGLEVSFEVVACDPYRWTWRVARTPATGHRVDPLGENRCRVVFEVPLLVAGCVPVCRRALDRIAEIA
jgi:hypothetical protein